MERFTKAQLVELCKKRNLPTTGLKKDLLERLKSATQKKETVIRVVLLEDGTFCHQETGFLLDPKSKRVTGRKSGEHVRALNRSDIALCKEYRLIYELPETLEEDRDDTKPILEKDDSDLSDWEESGDDENEEI